MKKHLLLLAGVAMMIASCTVEKRHYSSGYHIDWMHNKGKVNQLDKTEELRAQETSPATESIATEEVAVAPVQSEVVSSDMVAPQATANVAAAPSKSTSKREVRKEIRENARAIKQAMRAQDNAPMGATNFNNASIDTANEPDTVLLVVLCFFIPPLAVYLYEGEWTSRCTVNLILTLLCGLPGLIHALVIILGNK
jgi:uncharacterized membrane protein YqaE (UPF0057 family)